MPTCTFRKPITFATLMYNDKKKLFFGLPGNPVSAIVTCNMYVFPCIRKMSGRKHPRSTIIKAKVGVPVRGMLLHIVELAGIEI